MNLNELSQCNVFFWKLKWDQIGITYNNLSSMSQLGYGKNL